MHLAFGVRFNALAKDELRLDSCSSSLIAAAYEANSLTLKLDQQLPLWRIWPTATYQKYSRCMDVLNEEGSKLMRKWQSRAEEDIGERCLMDDYARDSNLTRKGEGPTYTMRIICGVTVACLFRFTRNRRGLPIGWNGYHIDYHGHDSLSYLEESGSTR